MPCASWPTSSSCPIADRDQIRRLPALRLRLRHGRHADRCRGNADGSWPANAEQEITTHLYGQEINPETYAICKADMLLKGEGESADHIVGGAEWSTLSHDAFPAQEFDFMLANPPYGKSWKKDLEQMGGKDGMRDPRFKVMHQGEELSLVTRSSDGQMLFLANMASKMNHNTPLGSRIAEVHNGSSLFTGDAGQGESNIRRWLIENDWLEAIVALPLNLFYNTGIATYVWVLTNRKPEHRQGKVQLIDATQWFKPLRKNLGKKNCELAPDDIQRICNAYLAFEETAAVEDFPQCRFRLLEGHGRTPAPPAQPAFGESHRVAPLRLRATRNCVPSYTTSSATSSFENFADIADALEKRLAEWGNDDEEDEAEEGASAEEGSARKEEKEAPRCQRRGNATAGSSKLRPPCAGNSEATSFEDYNIFRDRVDDALKKLEIKLSAAELKLILRAVSWRVETAPPVIAKVHRPGKATADPLHGPIRSTVGDRKPMSSNTNPIPTCATPSRCRCWKTAASRPSSVAKFCLTLPTRGSRKTQPRSATKSASRATFTSPSRSAPWRKSAPTSLPWKKKPRACSMNF